MYGSRLEILLGIILCYLGVLNAISWPFGKQDDWRGKWFPVEPGKVDNNPTYLYNRPDNSYQGRKTVPTNIRGGKHGIIMGQLSKTCDDAKTNLTTDWNNSLVNYTCFDDRERFLPNSNARPIYSCDHIPQEYNAPHKCMNLPITYDTNIPTFGAHRPIWPKYGEYRFLPRQRWIHNLEHGAIIMLYHPCSNHEEVQFLRKILTGCLYRHIITPYTLLTPERSIALVAWGCRLEISKVDPEIVHTFIKKHFNKGPERTSKDGQYDFELIKHADVVSDINDTTLCPNLLSRVENIM